MKNALGEQSKTSRSEKILYGGFAAAIIILAATVGLGDQKAFFLGFKAFIACFGVGFVLYAFGPKGDWLMRLSLVAVAGTQFMALIGHPVV